MKLQIGNVTLPNPVVLAPMAGVTDLPFRLLCKEQGVGLLCMEMVSAKAIYYKNKNTQDLSGMMEAYQEVLVNQDQQVRVLEPGHEYTGIARGINAMGELLVEREDGTITEVYAGEVSVRGLYGYV